MPQFDSGSDSRSDSDGVGELPQFDSGSDSDGGVGVGFDDVEDLPQFDVPQNSGFKFISKPEYKDLILLLMDIDDVAKNLLKQESVFLNIESDLAKDSLSIEKDVLMFKESLIKIDKNLFKV